MKFVSIFLSLCFSLAKAHSELERKVVDEPLPTGLSDLTATLDESTGIVYIAGGCDSESGNVFLPDAGLFVCDSISSALYSYSIPDGKLETLTSLPRERYRHGAALVNGQLWLVGGRNADDALIAEVDVYDIASKSWKTVASLPEEYQTSDHGVFSHGDKYVFVVGGYDANYTSLDTMYRIDATASVDDSTVIDDAPGAAASLSIEEMASLDNPRGDVTAVSSGEEAYISGGFTHENEFCEPLDSVEQYNFETDTWETIAPLNTPRADKALVIMEDKLYAVGGERQIENVCQIAEEDLPEVGEQTIPVDNVEVLENGGEWEILSSLPSHRFRFAAVAWEDTIYTFGGQSSYNKECQCFATTNEIVAYSEHDHDHEEEDAGGASSDATILRSNAICVAIMATLSALGIFM